MALNSLSNVFLFRACCSPLFIQQQLFFFPKIPYYWMSKKWSLASCFALTLTEMLIRISNCNLLLNFSTFTTIHSPKRNKAKGVFAYGMFKEVSNFNGSNYSDMDWFFSSGSEFFPVLFHLLFTCVIYLLQLCSFLYRHKHYLTTLSSTSLCFNFYSRGPSYSTKYQSKPFPYVTPEWASVFITTSWPVICPTGCCKRGIQAVCRWSNFGKTLCSTLQVLIIMLFFNQPRLGLSDPIHSSQP